MGFLGDLLGFGGDESHSSTSHQSTANNTAYNTDKRNVASDYAVAISGDGNVVDRSTSNLTKYFDQSDRSTSFTDSSNRSTNFTDSSNRSTLTNNLSMLLDNSNRSTNFSDSSVRNTTTSTSFSDSSNRSTNFTDNSDRSTYFSDSSNRSSTSNSNNSTSFVDNSDNRVYSTITDYGSVNAGVGLASAMGTKAMDSATLMSGQAFGVANTSIQGALANLMKQSETGLEATKLAFDMVRSSGANNLQSSAAVLGMAQSAIDKTAAAFQEASDGGEKKTIMYAIGAVAIIAVAFAMNR